MSSRDALGPALAGPWPGPGWPLAWPWLALGWPGSDQFQFRPVLVQTGSVQVILVRFAAILKAYGQIATKIKWQESRETELELESKEHNIPLYIHGRRG